MRAIIAQSGDGSWLADLSTSAGGISVSGSVSAPTRDELIELLTSPPWNIPADNIKPLGG